MSDDIEKINRIFHAQDDKPGLEAEEENEVSRRDSVVPRDLLRKKPVEAMDELLIDKSGRQQRNYTGDDETERDYHPIRQSHEYHTGCLGGLMYFAFILCISIVLACVAWMAASDMLALNKEDFTAVVTLPSSIFKSETVDELDEDGNKTGTKRITRADMDYVADVLRDAGLIEYKWLFEGFCRISNADQKVSPGEYELQSSFDYRALIQHMRAGSSSTVTVKVTIPEGFTMHEVFLRLEENDVCSYEELMQAATESSFNYSFLEGRDNTNANWLEGYLFPDTYEFYVGMQGSSAINKLLETFHYRMTADMLNQVQNLGMTLDDVINVASLIEKEAANDAERPIIASVIYNRLNNGIVLGIDAAVLYPYKDHEGAPTAEMLEADDPYNTRIKAGLTPTPICNPGLASINAALFPDSTGYFFYALDTATGTHKFFTNETEFNNFVATQDYS